MHVHINPVGGIAGDMFLAAVLDLWPQLWTPCISAIASVPNLASLQPSFDKHSDLNLKGRRVTFRDPHEGERTHAPHSQLQRELSQSGLDPAVRETACQILLSLAVAESTVHDVPIDEIHLHEVGAADSIADIVGAAFLIHSTPVRSWSCDPLPCGSGLVSTQHGELPVPVPAVAELLRGYPFHNDGRQGERVTPTGAAILKFLNPDFASAMPPMTLSGVGIGFGVRTMPGISNVLRLVRYQEIEPPVANERIAVIEFDIDDHSPEDLSIGVERIRAIDTVLDVLQFPAFGKKGRVSIHVRVLSTAEGSDRVMAACLSETATIGVRRHFVERRCLTRSQAVYPVADSDSSVTVKCVDRPTGDRTAKVEADDVAGLGDYASRKSLKQRIEQSFERDALRDGESTEE